MRAPETGRVNFESIAPRAWQAACELIGGADRALSCSWGDGFIINFGREPFAWQPPSPTIYPEWQIWHKDGDFFRHFLDSPEQGLLTLVLWSDVRHQGGATFVAADSVAPVARFLAAHPEGAYPFPQPPGVDDAPVFAFADLIAPCREFVEATGEAGDVYLLHPYILHAKSQNVLRLPRIITNPPLTLAEPMRFDRTDPSEFSLVERAVLRALDVSSVEFTPAAARQVLVPPRVAIQQERMAEEERRLAGKTH